MDKRMLQTVKAIALCGCALLMFASCKQGKRGSTNQTPTAATNSASNINNVAQNETTGPRDTTPKTIANEPPPPPPPSATPLSVHYTDSVAAETINMSLKYSHFNDVKASVTNGVVTLTGHAARKDLNAILVMAHRTNPKKIVNNLIVK